MEKVREAVLGHLEVRHGTEHGHGLFLGHGLTREISQGVVDRFPLGLEFVAHHDNLDEFVVDINVGPRHVENVTPHWCMGGPSIVQP